jgi:hypothetical protein
MSSSTTYLADGEGLGSWFSTFDHKKIAWMFLGWTMGMFLFGGLLAGYFKLMAFMGLDATSFNIWNRNRRGEFKAIDLLLEVTPHVTSDSRISINIKITKNDIYEETSPPALTTKEVETELLINDGDTIVIGGIIKTTKRDLDSGWPILSKLPGIGWLFKMSKSNDEKEELLIFLTPTIVQLEQPHI